MTTDPLMLPFSALAAAALGIPKRRLYSDEFVRPYPGVFLRRDIPLTLVNRCRAALVAAPPGATVSHHTAALLWHTPVPDSAEIHLAYSKPVKVDLDGIRIHRYREPVQRAFRHGLPVTTRALTLAHLVRHLSLVDLVAVADGYLRRELVPPEELLAQVDGLSGQGVRMARRAARFARPRVLSASETRLRMLMVLAGLPEPMVNYQLLRADGSVEYMLDLAYPEVRLAIEYDGRWHDDPAQRRRDDARRLTLTARGWTVVVLTARDLYDEPATMLAVLHDLCRDRGLHTPLRLDDQWRHYVYARGLVA